MARAVDANMLGPRLSPGTALMAWCGHGCEAVVPILAQNIVATSALVRPVHTRQSPLHSLRGNVACIRRRLLRLFSRLHLTCAAPGTSCNRRSHFPAPHYIRRIWGLMLMARLDSERTRRAR